MYKMKNMWNGCLCWANIIEIRETEYGVRRFTNNNERPSHGVYHFTAGSTFNIKDSKVAQIWLKFTECQLTRYLLGYYDAETMQRYPW